jgi:hypothetical protein
MIGLLLSAANIAAAAYVIPKAVKEVRETRKALKESAALRKQYEAEDAERERGRK